MSNIELVVINGMQQGQRYPVDGSVIRIGRDSESEIVLLDQAVSRRHARLIRKDDQVLVEDMGSRNGTYVGGSVIQTPVPLNMNDILQVGLNIHMRVEAARATEDLSDKDDGSETLDVPQVRHASNGTTGQQLPRPSLSPEDARRTSGGLPAFPGKVDTVPVPGAGPAPFTLHISGGPQAGELFPLSYGQHAVGRSPDNQIVLQNADISNHHCVIHVNEQGVWLQDLNSRNGTYVNSQSVLAPIWLNAGDVLQIGATLLARIEARPV
jgi:pSer/pThr/pTyr-binding forkhead associated (FHA) protein